MCLPHTVLHLREPAVKLRSVRCRPLTLDVITSTVIWPQEDWDFCRVRGRGEPALPPDAIVPAIPRTAATYEEVCVRTSALELAHVCSWDQVGSGTEKQWGSPRKGLVHDMLHAPASVLRIRTEHVDCIGLPSKCGRLSLTAATRLFRDGAPPGFLSHGADLKGAAAAGKYYARAARKPACQ